VTFVRLQRGRKKSARTELRGDVRRDHAGGINPRKEHKVLCKSDDHTRKEKDASGNLSCRTPTLLGPKHQELDGCVGRRRWTNHVKASRKKHRKEG